MSKNKKPIPINNAKDLKEYLKLKGENHIKYNHFTTSKSLNSIIQNKTFRLTLGDSEKLNDHHEFGAKGKEEVWDRTYIFCFTYNNNENMAMLGLYGLPSKEAIRFSLDNESINTLKNLNKINIYANSKYQNEIDKSLIEEIFFTDIFYVKDKYTKMPKHRDDYLDFQNRSIYTVITEPESTGLVKNDVWSQEKEVRLIIRFKEEQKDINGKLLEFVYLKFPEEILEKIQIMKGPGFDENYVNRIYDLNSLNHKIYKEEYNNKKLFRKIDSINAKIMEKNVNNIARINLVTPDESKFKGKIHFKSDNFIQIDKK